MQMIFFWLLILAFWVLIVVFPDALAYLVWGFFILLWLNIIIWAFIIKSKAKKDWIHIAWYKVYKS